MTSDGEPLYSFEFAKQPVLAVRLPWDFAISAVGGAVLDRPKPFSVPWLVINADSSMHLLSDETFRRLYSPGNDGAARYLKTQEPPGVPPDERSQIEGGEQEP
jgi:hypothetical protein